MPDFNPAQATIPGPKVLLMGDGGTGKTYSIGTLVDCGIEVFYVSIEQGMETLLGYWVDRGLPVPPNLHWHKIEPPKASYLSLAKSAHDVSTNTLKVLAERTDPERHLHNTMVKVNECFFNFKDDRTGQSFGAVDSWGPERAVVVDGLTGLSRAAMSLVVGGKPVRSPSDFGMAQQQLEGYLRLTCDHVKAWFVLLAHVEKEIDSINGGYRIVPATIGQKLPPLLPPMFADVAYATREVDKWYWSTTVNGVATKARNLPWADKIAPSFKLIYDRWAARAAAVLPPSSSTEEKPESPR